jgi:ADP-ribose pyrophosphatase
VSGRRLTDLAAMPAEPEGHLREEPLASRLAFDGGLLKVRRDIVRCSDGHVGYREYFRHPGAVMIVAMLDDDHVILERQYRYALARTVLEFPAGKRDAGEDPFDCARRELLEETGYRCARWWHLGGIHNSIGYSDERIELYLARDASFESGRPDPGEVVEIYRAPWRELDDWVRDGRITDVKTVIGIHWLQRVMSGDWQPRPVHIAG